MKRYDALVIGAGPAGLTAALYLARFALNVALVEKLTPGGLLLQTAEIENYPGFPKGAKGYELADAFSDQLLPYPHVTRIADSVVDLDCEGDVKRVRVGEEWIEADSIIICSGVSYRKLGLPEEDRFLGKGVSYCALCDGHFFRGQDVLVVGGGNSALEEALYLSKMVSRLHIVHRRDAFRGASVYVSRIKEQANIQLHLSSVVTALHGDKELEAVTIKRLPGGEEEVLPVQGLFVFIGFTPTADFLTATSLRLDAQGFIETDSEMRTNIPGVFAAGDIRSKLCRQVVTAVGDGATAANSAHTYLMEQKHA